MKIEPHKTWDVLGFGAVAVDDLVYVEHYPAVDTKEQVRATQRQGGGLAGTALVTAARLGVRSAYCGALGRDELSEFTLQEFGREGVDCSSVFRLDSAAPIHSIVIVEIPTGSRTLFFDLSGLKPPPLETITPELIQRSRMIFVDHTVMEASIRAAEIAHTLDIPVVADIERGDSTQLADLARQIDHLVIGVEMGRRLSGVDEPVEMVRALSNPNRASVVVTVGGEGCWFSVRGQTAQHQPALKVQVVDTVGCGDVFHGAYMASLARGGDVPTAVRAATITAGLKTTQPGGRSGIPTWDQVLKILEV